VVPRPLIVSGGYDNKVKVWDLIAIGESEASGENAGYSIHSDYDERSVQSIIFDDLIRPLKKEVEKDSDV
jgi:hypothetical protein